MAAQGGDVTVVTSRQRYDDPKAELPAARSATASRFIACGPAVLADIGCPGGRSTM